MKLMKHITIALVLCAIPAMAFGQVTTTCDACTHDVSVYMGEGGVIATATMDDDGAYNDVTWVATCGGVTRSGTLMPGSDGTVSALFSADDGSSCATQGTMEIGPVEDGGWYWITGDTSSAVGGLVNKDVLKNKAATITKAGGVTETAGSGAVLLKQASTGRMGILPTILPEPPTAALMKCGYKDNGSRGNSAIVGGAADNARFTRVYNGCALGDGGASVLATVYNTVSGAITPVSDGGTIVRPGGTGSVEVTIDLWANGTGHFTTSLNDASAFNAGGTVNKSNAKGHALLGHPAIGYVASLRPMARLQGVTYRATLGSGPTAARVEGEAGVGGISIDVADDAATVTIKANSSYCNVDPPRNTSALVSVAAIMASADDTSQVTPAVARARDWGHSSAGPRQLAGTTSFTVVCGGSSSANQGQELVPENPFPTDE